MDTTVRELQCCELNILKAFIEVCEKNQLQYYLGAVPSLSLRRGKASCRRNRVKGLQGDICNTGRQRKNKKIKPAKNIVRFSD